MQHRRRARPHARASDLKLGICGEHGGDPASVAFCHEVGLDYVSLLALPRADRPPGRGAGGAVAAAGRDHGVTALSLAALAAGGKAALASALAQLERAPEAAETLALLDAAYAAPRAHVVGLTGPPGVGKSTLDRRAHRALARRPAAASASSPSIPRRAPRAARCSATARGCAPIPTMPASSCARWRRATGSAASPRSPSPPWC